MCVVCVCVCVATQSMVVVGQRMEKGNALALHVRLSLPARLAASAQAPLAPTQESWPPDDPVRRDVA
jgi:hypothetical protein